MSASSMTFVAFIGVHSWERYTRRPHVDPLKHQGTLIVCEAPVVIRPQSFRILFRSLFRSSIRQYHGVTIIKPLAIVPAQWVMRWPWLSHLYFAHLRHVLRAVKPKDSLQVHMLFSSHQHFYKRFLAADVYTLDYNDKFDLYPNLTEGRRAIVRENERAILKAVDVVFATSWALKRNALNYNNSVCWLPNCVEDHFDAKFFVPDEVQRLKKPVIGFVGHINEWLNLAWIEWMAHRHPEWMFVFIGRLPKNWSSEADQSVFHRLQSLNNIEFWGEKAYQDLYSYIRHFHVATIWYSCDEFKRYVHPNKLYMYLSAGVPIVSTDFFPEARRIFGELVSFARTKRGV
jgi:glycosyltransferase involved in cell wall biosynthesis